MENANKALIMAAGTLIAVMLLTLFVVFINKASIWPETEDEIKTTEQLAKFNAEYEVYQKSAMYGVDVISCLNKAKSNNEKYVEGGSFLGELAYGKNYEINVTIELKTKLTESIEVTAIQSYASGYRESSVLRENTTIQDFNKLDLKLKDVFKELNSETQLTNFNENDDFKYSVTNEDTTIEPGVKHQLIDSSGGGLNPLVGLLNHSNNPRVIVKNVGQLSNNNNKSKDKNYLYEKTETNVSYGWNTATWSTYLYSFKQKKFECTNIEYSTKTGRVNKIEFKEL